jgi:hypothetical protein
MLEDETVMCSKSNLETQVDHVRGWSKCVSGNMSSPTVCRAIADSSSFLSIVFHFFDNVDPDPIKYSRVRWWDSGSAKHALCIVIVELNVLDSAPFRPGIRLLELVTCQTRRRSDFVDRWLPNLSHMILDNPHLIEVKLWKASMTQSVHDFIESESNGDIWSN